MLRVAAHLKGFPPLTAEQLDSIFIRREFVSRQQIDRIHFIEGALGVDIKGAQAVDFIIKEINPERQFAAHRKQIQQCAANGELAVLQYLFDTAVTALNQLFTQLVP